ncbi:lipase class 3 family protein [Amanita rubescens]|nr:lipase class 3 family protein [Amanita rubescens]
MTPALSLLSVFSAVVVALSVRAAPLEPRQSITSLSTKQIDFFTPYTWFASTGYCSPSTTISWSCGANCEANPDFIPVASGGDGGDVQYWFVGYSPSLSTVIVSHQGTNTASIEAIATDINAFQEILDPSLFPGIDSSIEVHSGFANEQAKTATEVLSAIQKTISEHGADHITVVGHSLGAAIALLDSVYLPLHLPSGVSIQDCHLRIASSFQVGNQAFANYVDANLHLTHINNMKDPIPIVPGKFVGYVHPSGEVHITEKGPWESCPGQDNPSTFCIVGDVPNILVGDPSNHSGPYNGITMGNGC